MKQVPLILLSILFSVTTGAQDTTRTKVDSLPDRFYYLENITRDGETMPEIALDEVSVVSKMSLKKRFQWWKHRRLVYNIKKVYPFIIIVRESLGEVNNILQSMPDDKERRRYLKDYEKSVFDEYEDDMRKMTITQGRILIKLIDRETQNTSYELIKVYRGSVSAVFWQGIARIFGTNLKVKYDPADKDYLIERIVLEIEAGRI
ncbi:MAG: DUF4294 domain-containing protein [Bacteroidales bacterium]|nr:DUF4294 domain-containing protein [Bacteroidales bacterium]